MSYEPYRLNKYIAHSGVCSRRKAAELVKNGEIKVNDLINKDPSYLVTTTADERARKTVMDILENKIKERIYPVGRLDRNTTGLLLITNDGDLATKLSHPKHGVRKRYHVILDKPVTEDHLKLIKKGLTLDDGRAVVDDIDWIIGSDNSEVGIEIHIGKNRIVRRIFEHLGYHVEKLDRVYYGGLTKKDLPRGWFRHLKPKEIIMLKHFKS